MLCISFSFVSIPPVPPVPALCSHRSACSSGETEKSRCCWSDSSDPSVNVTATFAKFHGCIGDDFFKIVLSFITMLLTFFFFHNKPSLYRAAYLKKKKKTRKRKFFLSLTPLFCSSAPQGFTYSQCNFLYINIYIFNLIQWKPSFCFWFVVVFWLLFFFFNLSCYIDDPCPNHVLSFFLNKWNRNWVLTHVVCQVFFSPSNPKLYEDAVMGRKKKRKKTIMPAFSLALLLLPMVYYYCSVAVYKEMWNNFRQK